jgi:hypothetical protein
MAGVDDLFNAAGKALRQYTENMVTPIQKAVNLAPPPQTGENALVNTEDINATAELTPYEEALQEVVLTKSIDGNSARNIIDSISFHESGGEVNDQTLAQGGGGPARGVMQFEPPRFTSSVQRAKNYYKDTYRKLFASFTPESDLSTPEWTETIIPEWLRNIPTRNLKYKNNKVIRDNQFRLAQQDITNLTVDQQKALATYDLLHGPSNLADVTEGRTTVEDFWADTWWKGASSKRTEHIASFKASMRNRDQRAAAAAEAAAEAAQAQGDPITDAINRTNGIAEQDMFPLYV